VCAFTVSWMSTTVSAIAVRSASVRSTRRDRSGWLMPGSLRAIAAVGWRSKIDDQAVLRPRRRPRGRALRQPHRSRTGGIFVNMPPAVLQLAAYSGGRRRTTRHDPGGDWRHIVRDTTGGALPEHLATLVEQFAEYLAGNPKLSELTRQAYPQRVRAFLRWLEAADLDGVAGDPLVDERAAQAAVLAYEQWQRTVARRAASTINAHGVAVGAFYAWRGVQVDVVRHEVTPQRRSLELAERRRLDHYVGTAASLRERAVYGVLRYGGLRRSELVHLDIGDVALSGHGGAITVRHGKGRSLR